MYIKISMGCILNNLFQFKFLFPKKSKLAGCFEFTSHNGLTQLIPAHCKSPETIFHIVHLTSLSLRAGWFSWPYVKKYHVLFFEVTPRDRKIEKILRQACENFES